MAYRLDDVVLVAGHRRMVGAANVRRLQALGYRGVLTASRDEVDLCSQADVQ